MSRRTIALAAAGVLVTAAAAIAWMRQPPHASPESVAPARIAVVVVDDDPTRARSYFDRVAGQLPAGAQVASEALRGVPGEVRYLRIVPVDGETLGACLERVRAWAYEHPLPSGGLGFGPLDEVDEDGRSAQVGHRSYSLVGDPIVTDGDVAEASAQAEPGVGAVSLAIQLTPAASERFASATAASVGRRLAFVLNGVVVSAPLVMSPITGGALLVAIPPGSADGGLAAVQRLAASLDPRTRAD